MGPNGAGKTTTLRCLAGIITPDRGRGARSPATTSRPTRWRPSARLAFVPDEPHLFDYLTVERAPRGSSARLYGVDGRAEPRPGAARGARARPTRRDALPGELSRGMKQKLAIACGLLHEPQRAAARRAAHRARPGRHPPHEGDDRRARARAAPRSSSARTCCTWSRRSHAASSSCSAAGASRSGRWPRSAPLAPGLSQDASLEDIFLTVTGARGPRPARDRGLRLPAADHVRGTASSAGSRRLREPRYLIPFAVSLLWLGILGAAPRAAQRLARAGRWAGTRCRRRRARRSSSSAGSGSSCGSCCCGSCPTRRRALEFSPAEIHFLFPAPVTRRQLVQYKLLRAQVGILFGALVSAFFFGARFTHADGWARVLALWLFFAIGHLHGIAASFVRTDLIEAGLERRAPPGALDRGRARDPRWPCSSAHAPAWTALAAAAATWTDPDGEVTDKRLRAVDQGARARGKQRAVEHRPVAVPRAATAALREHARASSCATAGSGW